MKLLKKITGLTIITVMVGFLVMLLFAGTASAVPITIPLSDFVIFSGGGLTISGGNETEIGGHTLINGNIGSNQDLFYQGNPLAGYPAQLNGSAYVGGNLYFGQDLTVGSSTELREVVVNGVATISGGVKIWGTLDANSYTLGSGASVTGGVTTSPSADTFQTITMPAYTVFTAGGANQTVPAATDVLTLAPGTYGALATTQQDQTVTLSSGNYYFDSITAQGGFKLKIDLTSGQPINIYVVGNVTFAQNNTLMVKGAGTGGIYVPLDQAPELAALIYLETHGRFVMGGATDAQHNIWGGTVYASLLEGSSAEVMIGQYMDWYGAAYSYDSFDVADHGSWNYVPLTTPVPEPATMLLLGSGLVGLAVFGRKKFFKKD